MPFQGGLIAPALLEPARVAGSSTSRSPTTVSIAISGGNSGDMTVTIAAGGPAPSLSSVTFWNTRAADPGFGTTATLQFRSNGTLYYTNGSGSPIEKVGSWWSGGLSVGIGASYDVRCASISSGPAWQAQAAAVGSWITMDNNRDWTVNRQTDVSGSGTTETVGVFEIQANSGAPVLASASFTGQAILT